MLRGIVAAGLVSVVWIVLQNVWMLYRPAEARLTAMGRGFALSLPLLFAVERILPVEVPEAESPFLGPLQAIILHTLIFFCYAECFYHVERSVTLRLLIELLPYQASGATVDDIRSGYSQDDMVARRLTVLERSGFVQQRGKMWELTRMGLAYATVVEALSWLFQSQPQSDRG